MRTLAAVLVSAFLAAAQSRLSTEEAAQGWILLFDGESTFGWTSEGGAEWKVVDGALVAETGQYGWLRHNAVFADFELQADFRTAADGNSGIFLRSNRGGSPHVSGYELQIFDGHEKYPTGSIVAHAAAKGAKIKGGEWQTFHVTARGPAIEVRLDGNAVLKMSDRKSPAGHIGLQFNPGKKIEFRNVRLRPLAM
ncbi:MAG TPA: DUF1080 domain-containing protein, partial [Bryobacteraceae bacterium]|nr:DUF1080 domain-containing protein [Bryobacteraceae bacterium]